MRILQLHLGLALTVLAFGGCGSGSSEDAPTTGTIPDQPQQVAQAYADTIAHEDAGAACESLPPDLAHTTGDTCPGTVGAELVKDGSEVDYLGEVTDVEVNGDTAQANFSGGGFLSLSKTNGVWYVDLVR